MEKNPAAQVEMDDLLFTQSWEDPDSDLLAFGSIRGKSVMGITSGACNVLHFLLHDPKEVFAVDINPAQSWVLELKMAAMRRLDYETFLGFLGLKPQGDRRRLFDVVKSDLSAEAAQFWENRGPEIHGGFLGKGKFEGYIRKSARMMRLLQGKRRVRQLFEEKSGEEQRKFFDERWNTWQLRTAFNFLYSKRNLAKRGLKDDYFQFDDGSKSFAENFYNRHRNVMREVPLKGNYFVALYLMGHYRNLHEVPAYLQREHFEVIRSRLGRVHIVSADAKVWMQAMPASSLDAFAMSNIFELMADDNGLETWKSILHAAREGARVCYRNLMVPRSVPVALSPHFVRDDGLSKRLLGSDRSFVYSKVEALVVRKVGIVQGMDKIV